MKNKYGTKLDVNKFKSDFCALFWNFVWYCKVYELDYSILLPYSERIEQIRTNKIIYNQNLNNIKLVLDNDIYKSMDLKLKEIESGFVRKESKGSTILDNKFQNLDQVNVESFVIERFIKSKYKKNISKLVGNFLKKKSSGTIKENAFLNKILEIK